VINTVTVAVSPNVSQTRLYVKAENLIFLYPLSLHGLAWGLLMNTWVQLTKKLECMGYRWWRTQAIRHTVELIS